VVVATVRALKMHGGVAREDLKTENLEALRKGLANLSRHVENVRRFGVPLVVAINKFSADTRAEVDAVRQACAELGVEAVEADHWAAGGAGAEELARAVTRTIDEQPSDFHTLYPDDMPLWEKTRAIAQNIYGARDIIADKKVHDQFRAYQDQGFGHFPICVAKTQYSFSTDPELKGAPSDHIVPVREVRLAGGAEFLVVICGDIMTMPGLPRRPAAEGIGVDENGQIAGLF
jgi:formate--tetrahydrofolate ligase